MEMNQFGTEDRYARGGECINRLILEWKKYNQLIVTFDYDNTVFDFHNRGDKYPNVIAQLQTLARMGCHLICFTSCEPSRFSEIQQHLKQIRIPHRGINVDSILVPFNGRKIYFNVHYDDRAGLGSVLNYMETVIHYRSEHVSRFIKENFELTPEELDKVYGGDICPVTKKPFMNGDWYYSNDFPMISREGEEIFGSSTPLPVFEELLPLIIN